MKKIMIGVALGVFVFVALFSIWGTMRELEREAQEEEREEEGWAAERQELEAMAVCRNHVEERLVAPASAKWPWDDSQVIHHLGGKRYRAQTHVDSQDASGAMLRTPVDCIVQQTEIGIWKLESLNME